MDKEIENHINKTGTTTLGIVCKDGIVVAADKRISFGGDSGVSYIASAKGEKIQEVGANIIVTTAGVVSEIQKIIKLIKAELKLKELKSRSKPTIKQAANLFATISYQNIRQFSTIPGVAHFLLAGFDDSGFYLYDISPDGCIQEIKDYTSTGSGMIHVNPLLDSEYKTHLTIEEGVKLAKKCINASSKRDPASGEGIDIYVVSQDQIKPVSKQRFEISAKEMLN